MTVMERRMAPLIDRHPEIADMFEAFPFVRVLAPETHVIRLEEYREGDTYVVRAELPGIDPAEDVEITVDHGTLTIHAERVEEMRDKARCEFRYGSFSRRVALPDGVKEEDITASYDKGILTVKAPVGEVRSAPRRVAIGRSS